MTTEPVEEVVVTEPGILFGRGLRRKKKQYTTRARKRPAEPPYTPTPHPSPPIPSASLPTLQPLPSSSPPFFSPTPFPLPPLLFPPTSSTFPLPYPLPSFLPLSTSNPSPPLLPRPPLSPSPLRHKLRQRPSGRAIGRGVRVHVHTPESSVVISRGRSEGRYRR